jgi:hypothetical protein
MAIAYYGRTFSEDHLPAPDRLLGDAEFLMIRKDDPTSMWMWRLYEPAILARYRLAGESRYWIAWKRTPEGRPTSLSPAPAPAVSAPG